MKLRTLGETATYVWSLDPDVEMASDRTEEATNNEGKPSREGYMVPYPEGATAHPGAVVWTLRPLTMAEFEALTPSTRNLAIAQMSCTKAQVIGGEEYTGEALCEVVEAQGLALQGDLASEALAITTNPFLRRR